MNYSLKETKKGIDLEFITEDGVFSPRNIDKGTLAMLELVDFDHEDKVLDLGCGYGVVGVLAAKFISPERIYMIDNSDIAIRLSKDNIILNKVSGVKILKSDGLKELNENDFTKILSNPPYHTDFSVAKEFIEKGFNRLKIGGKMYMVTKRDLWYRKKFISIFGGVNVYNRDGYFIFVSEKRDKVYANIKKKV